MNKEMILGIVRHGLTFGGGFITSAHYATNDDVTTAVGALMTLIGFVWSIIQKVRANQNLRTPQAIQTSEQPPASS